MFPVNAKGHQNATLNRLLAINNNKVELCTKLFFACMLFIKEISNLSRHFSFNFDLHFNIIYLRSDKLSNFSP